MSIGATRAAARSLRGIVAALSISASLPGHAANAQTLTPLRTVFIVTCRCDTPADRQRVAKAVRRQGGSIVYTYDTMPGLAVASPCGGDADRFMVQLRRIANVTDVRMSEAHKPQSTNQWGTGSLPR